MSTKPTTSKKDNSTVLTRHKSAQMKRQLRTNDASIRRISQYTRLLMSPTREKGPRTPKTSPKGKKGAKTSPKNLGKEKKSQLKLTEYYPDKLKRNVRKSRKGMMKVNSEENESREMMNTELQARPRSPSLPRLLSLAEESLDDDSLLEILTADSPVWWDDPPDHTYTEEPICILSREEVEYMIKQTQSMNKDLQHETKRRDTFMKKRNKLEHLLGNIKNKLNNDSKGERDTNIVEDKGETKMEIDHKDSQDCKNMEMKEKTIDMKDETEEVRNSESSDVTNDDMIKDLENIQIPIEKENSDECEIVETNFFNQVKDNVDSNDNLKQDHNVEEVNKADLKVKEIKTSKEIVDKNKAKFTISSIEVSSPTLSARSVISDTSEISSLVSTSDNLDTISDTNIKFLEEDVNGKIVEMKKEEEDKEKDIKEDENKHVRKRKEEQKQRKKLIDKEQLMTVYKIITDDNYREQIANNKNNELSHTNIDTFCKNIKNNQQKVRKIDIFNQNYKNEKHEDTMNIASDVKTAKYCKKCSSIFESEKCVYCVQRAKISGVEYHSCTVTLKT